MTPGDLATIRDSSRAALFSDPHLWVQARLSQKGERFLVVAVACPGLTPRSLLLCSDLRLLWIRSDFLARVT